MFLNLMAKLEGKNKAITPKLWVSYNNVCTTNGVGLDSFEKIDYSQAFYKNAKKLLKCVATIVISNALTTVHLVLLLPLYIFLVQ